MPELYREREEEEEQQVPQGIPAPIPASPEEDFFRYRIDGSDILEDMQHQLRGEIFDANKNCYVKKYDRWINDEGISKVLHVIYACGINKNTFLGNLSAEQIAYKCLSLKRAIARLFLKNYNLYEIDKEMRTLLIATIVNTIHSGLSRSEGGRESSQLSTAAQRHDIYSHQDTNKKEGFMSNFLKPRR